MNKNRCERCSYREEDLSICVDCGKAICENCTRVADPELFPEDEYLDRCIECNAKAGYTDLWDVWRREQGGDIMHGVVDVEVNRNTFEVIALCNGPMWKVCDLKKRKFTEEE